MLAHYPWGMYLLAARFRLAQDLRSAPGAGYQSVQARRHVFDHPGLLRRPALSVARLQWLRSSCAAILVVLAWTGCAFAADPASDLTPASGLERVQAGKADAYHEVLAEFDAAIHASPDDPTLAVSRCQFIGQFTDEDYEWIESAAADFKACREGVEARWPTDPNVQLFALDQLWGEEATTRGETLLRGADAWPAALRRRLLTRLSEDYDNRDGTSARGGELAVMAAQLGETSRVAAAVAYLAAKGESTPAQALLRQAPAATTAWQASRRVTAALALSDHAAALAELRRYQQADFEVDAVAAAKAHMRAGDAVAARRLLEGKTPATQAIKQARFDAALAAGDAAAAAQAIDITDSRQFPLVAQHFALVVTQSPATLLSGRMMLVMLAMLLLLALLAAAPGLVLVPVHYRGLMRRVRGKAAVPLFERINLRHAWLGGAVAICIPLMVAFVVVPGAIATLLGGEDLPDQAALLRLTLWATLVGLLVLVPVIPRLGLRTILGDRTVWRGWWRVLLAWVALFAVGVAVNLWNRNAGDTSTLQTKMVESLVGGGFQQYGLAVTLLLMAVVVPLYEEIIFRGLLLGGMSAHISFGWANLIQAVLFAVVHGDNPRFVFYLTLGLLSGWLARKSRSLGPSIALHGANNALATLLRYAA